MLMERYCTPIIVASGFLILIILYLALLKTEQYDAMLQEKQEIIAEYEELIEATREVKRQLKAENESLLLVVSAYRLSTTYNVTMYGYTAREKETNNDPTNTAIMEKPIPGWTIAVSHDLKFLLGKRVYIPGRGVFYANDLMNERHTMSIDILFGTVEEAKRFGVQEGEMILLEPYLILKDLFYANTSF